MTLGEFLFRQLRTHEIARSSKDELWLALPQRRRDEYELAALATVEENRAHRGASVGQRSARILQEVGVARAPMLTRFDEEKPPASRYEPEPDE